MCKYKQNEELKNTQVDRGGAEIFTLNPPTKTREKVRINGKYFHMQVDTSSDITLIKPRLKKSALQLKQFAGTIIKTLGTFEGTFETKNRFEIIPITVVACVEKRKISYFVLARYLIQHWISPNQDDISYSARTFISG